MDANPSGPSALYLQLAEYLKARGVPFPSDSMQFHEAIKSQAAYVLGEAYELCDAVDDLLVPVGTDVEQRIRLGIADVVLAATALAEFFGVSVEGCIAEKTEAAATGALRRETT